MPGTANHLEVPQYLQQPKPKNEMTEGVNSLPDPHRESTCPEVTITITPHCRCHTINLDTEHREFTAVPIQLRILVLMLN
jgi:hypothetical protein